MLIVLATRCCSSRFSSPKAFEVGLKQGKTPIVVKDVPGFFVNRCLGPYIDEAMALLQSGADVNGINKAMVQYGFPVGCGNFDITLLFSSLASHQRRCCSAESDHAGYIRCLHPAVQCSVLIGALLPLLCSNWDSRPMSLADEVGIDVAASVPKNLAGDLGVRVGAADLQVGCAVTVRRVGVL